MPLAKRLLRHNLTLVETIRSNKREISQAFKNTRARPLGSSILCFNGPSTLVSYKPKPAKMVYLVSSCDEDTVVNHTNGKPILVDTASVLITYDQR